MAVFKHIVVFSLMILLIFFLQPSRSKERCDKGCGNQPIRFPFQMITTQEEVENQRCGYPGFEVSCKNQTQNVILFPSSGEFRIDTIDYVSQLLFISDPDECMAKRLVEGFVYSDTLFQPLYARNFTFFNCTDNSPIFQSTGAKPISCLSAGDYYAVALPTDTQGFHDWPSCVKIATVSYPTNPFADSVGDLIKLTWTQPDCKLCEGAGGVCNFRGHSGLDVGCFSPGFLVNLAYTLLFAVGFGLWVIGFIICMRKIKHHDQGQLGHVEMTAPPPGNVVVKGLDSPTIERYPTTLLGDSVQLPNSADNVCSICLLEYQANDTLRTIPSCSHYFHAHCIDAWLKRKATCPLCRN